MEQNYEQLDNMAADISIYTKDGFLGKEKGLVAIDRNTQKILAMGEASFLASGQNPGVDIQILLPFSCGMVTNYPAAERFIRYLLAKHQMSKRLIKPKIALVVPEVFSDVNQKALEDMCYQAGAKKVLVEDTAQWSEGYETLLEKYQVVIVIGKDEPVQYIKEMSNWLKEYAKKNGIDTQILRDS